ncbi:DUF6232 family protein [Aliarcobacter butzleri]|uniref:DUF6232 family protein n=1 Tax=Aliarcobacter butzleri TaxID=28197 RepID=UPI0024DE9EE3|nr:DUF6232 family protein [Aliarcobacter butzleri]MDK2082877.1 DUF6232 family protein [Aliarcobacter butzleri]
MEKTAEEINEELAKFQKQVYESYSIALKISNQLIEYGNSVYPMRNIASTNLVEKVLNEKKFEGQKVMIVSILMFLTIFFGTTITTILGIAGIIGFFVSLKMYKNIEHKYYGLALVTNGGTNDLLYSQDKEFISKIGEIIKKAMIENGDVQFNIHIGDKTFIDNSKTEITHNITNNIDLKVEHHHGLSKEDLAFLMGDFKTTIEKLYSEIANIKDAQLSKEELDNIVSEINSKNPDVSKIKKSWNLIKTACDGYGTLTTLGDFGSMIGRVTLMFIS